MKQLLIILFLFALLFSCNSEKGKKSTEQIVDSAYNDMIINAALAFYSYNNIGLFRGFPQDDHYSQEFIDKFLNDIITIRDSNYFSTTGLRMNLHYVSVFYGHSYEDILVYVENDTFNHIIPFLDDQKLLEKTVAFDKSWFDNDTAKLNEFVKQYDRIFWNDNTIMIDKHLNYILYNLVPASFVLNENSLIMNDTLNFLQLDTSKIRNLLFTDFSNSTNFTNEIKNSELVKNLDTNDLMFSNELGNILDDLFTIAYETEQLKIKREKIANELITQFTDLLYYDNPDESWNIEGFYEVTLKDTLKVLSNTCDCFFDLKKYMTETNGNSKCQEVAVQNYNKIIENLKTGKYRYFKPIRGAGALWCFYTETDKKGRIQIKVEFVNLECYNWFVM
jgi:hypothetical protein